MYGPPAVWTKLPQDPSGASRSEGSAQITRGEHSPQCNEACVGTGPGARPCGGVRGAQSADHAQGGAYTRRVLSHEALPILACSKSAFQNPNRVEGARRGRPIFG